MVFTVLLQPGPNEKSRPVLYYQRYVPHFYTLAAPITELYKKGKPDKVIWTTECQSASCFLKEALSKDPILAHLNFDKPFVVYSDASEM